MDLFEDFALPSTFDYHETSSESPIHPGLLQEWKSIYKRDLCFRFRETGRCRDGKSCIRAHGARELSTQPVEELSPQVLKVFMSKYKVELCHDFRRGRCSRGAACHRAHGKHELRPLPGTKTNVQKKTGTTKVSEDKMLYTWKKPEEKSDEQIDWFDMDSSASSLRTPEVSIDATEDATNQIDSNVKVNKPAIKVSKSFVFHNSKLAQASAPSDTDSSKVDRKRSSDVMVQTDENVSDEFVRTERMTVDTGIQTMPQICLAGHCIPTTPPRATFEGLFAVKKPSEFTMPSVIVRNLDSDDKMSEDTTKHILETVDKTDLSSMDENRNSKQTKNKNSIVDDRVEPNMTERREPEGQNRDAILASPAPPPLQGELLDVSVDFDGLAQQLRELMNLTENRSDLGDVMDKLETLQTGITSIFLNLRELYTFMQVQFGPWNVDANARILEGLAIALNEMSAVNSGQLELKHCWDSAVGAFGKVETRLQSLEDRLLQQEREMVKNVTLTYSILESSENLEKIKKDTQIIKESAKLTNHVEQQRDLILVQRFEEMERKLDRLSLKIEGSQSMAAFANMKLGCTTDMIQEAVPMLVFLCDQRRKINESKLEREAELEKTRTEKEKRKREIQEEARIREMEKKKLREEKRMWREEKKREREELERKKEEEREQERRRKDQEEQVRKEEKDKQKEKEEQEMMKQKVERRAKELKEEEERRKREEESPQFFVCHLCGRVPRGTVVLDMNCGSLVGCERCVQLSYSPKCVRCGRKEKYQVLTSAWEVVLENCGVGEGDKEDRKLEYFDEA